MLTTAKLIKGRTKIKYHSVNPLSNQIAKDILSLLYKPDQKETAEIATCQGQSYGIETITKGNNKWVKSK